MSLSRSMLRRQRRQPPRVFREITRAMIADYAAQTRPPDVSASAAIAAAMRAWRRGELEIEIDEANDLVRVRPKIV